MSDPTRYPGTEDVEPERAPDPAATPDPTTEDGDEVEGGVGPDQAS